MASDPLFIFDLDDTLAHTTRDLQGDPKRLPELKLLRGVRPVLTCVKNYSVLLTAGTKDLQQKKIDHLGIGGLFKEIKIIANREEKEQALKEILAKAEATPDRVIVVGDRVDHEIRYGNQLGCTTVRMSLAGGKYNDLLPESGFDLPIHAVKDAAELARTLEAFL